MMRVLIAYDGSAPSRAAIEDLRRAGLPDDAEATVLSVGEVWFPSPSSYGLVDTDTVADGVLVREAGEVARAGGRLVEATFPSWAVREEPRAGSPGREILEAAREIRPDLLVVGSHGRTGLAKLFLGSVSQKVAGDAPCSVRIGRESIRPYGPLRVVLAIEGSAGGDAAVAEVAARSWPDGTHVRVVTAIGPSALDGAGVREQVDHAREIQARAIGSLQTVGLKASSKILAADPRQLVIEEAANWPADCIFVGATGLVSLERALFGTVVAAVAGRASCSVEVIRRRY